MLTFYFLKYSDSRGENISIHIEMIALRPVKHDENAAF